MNDKKFGFTLSELLLTISMIGVIATLTISTIGSSVQQKARLSEFRATYARLDTALNNIINDEGLVYFCYYLPNNDDKALFGLTKVTATESENKDCSTLENAFSKSLGRVRTCDSTPQTKGCLPNNYPADTAYFKKNSSNTRAYVMDNGMILWVSTQGIRTFAVDINGRSAPNKWGQDIFPFMIKVTETKTIGNNIIPVSVAILPPPPSNADFQPPVTSTGKTTRQLMLDSANKK